MENIKTNQELVFNAILFKKLRNHMDANGKQDVTIFDLTHDELSKFIEEIQKED